MKIYIFCGELTDLPAEMYSLYRPRAPDRCRCLLHKNTPTSVVYVVKSRADTAMHHVLGLRSTKGQAVAVA